ncbi:hypothetical protein [Streptomyces sp. NPDC001100]
MNVRSGRLAVECGRQQPGIQATVRPSSLSQRRTGRHHASCWSATGGPTPPSAPSAHAGRLVASRAATFLHRNLHELAQAVRAQEADLRTITQRLPNGWSPGAPGDVQDRPHGTGASSVIRPYRRRQGSASSSS